MICFEQLVVKFYDEIVEPEIDSNCSDNLLLIFEAVLLFIYLIFCITAISKSHSKESQMKRHPAECNYHI